MKRYLIIGALLVSAIGQAETSNYWNQEVFKGERELIDEKQRRISQPLAFYEQLRNLELKGDLRTHQWKKDPVTQEWLHRKPNFDFFDSQEEIDKHAILTPYRFELVLKDWDGTITYRSQNKGEIVAVRKAHVYLSNEVGQYSGDISQGLVVRIRLDGPQYGYGSEYATALFLGDLRVMIDDNPYDANPWDPERAVQEYEEDERLTLAAKAKEQPRPWVQEGDNVNVAAIQAAWQQAGQYAGFHTILQPFVEPRPSLPGGFDVVPSPTP